MEVHCGSELIAGSIAWRFEQVSELSEGAAVIKNAIAMKFVKQFFIVEPLDESDRSVWIRLGLVDVGALDRGPTWVCSLRYLLDLEERH